MKQLEKSDLKEGDIYVSSRFHSEFLNKHSFSGKGYGLDLKFKNDFRRDWLFAYNNIRKATPEEKHWLEICIKADKFVSYEKAMKTFIPEYVECISWKSHLANPSHVEGVVYKILDSGFVELNPKYSLGIPTRYLRHQEYFKPSTKEAYDAQFVVKEPEFVLPEIWWVRITEENLEDVCKFLGFEPYDNAVGNIAGMCKHFRTGKIEKGWNGTPTTIYGTTFGNEITTEQFKKYVLKIENENVSKFINNTTVINKEGEVFKVGDVIKSTNGTLKDKIISFRWKNDKSEICAVLPNIPNGIGIDKIELYIEPKVEPKQELSLLEQAKLKYPVGTKYIPTLRSLSKITEISSGLFIETPNFILNGINYTSIYYKQTEKWAEIVEDFVLPKYWWIEASNISEFEIIIKFFNTKFRGTILNNGDYFEGCSFGFVPCFDNGDYYYSLTPDSKQKYLKLTLEQFKKYVLNEKV